MHNKDGVITLGQGDLYFGAAPGTITTLLGSCVAVTLWHRRLHIGGMCHIVVPHRIKQDYDNRYPHCAVDQFMKDIYRYGTRPGEYEVGIYGGGNMFPNIQTNVSLQVGQRNIERMLELMDESGFVVSEFHVGGHCYRRVLLRLDNGEVQITGRDVKDFMGSTEGVNV